MDWLLYNNGLRLERVKNTYFTEHVWLLPQGSFDYNFVRIFEKYLKLQAEFTDINFLIFFREGFSKIPRKQDLSKKNYSNIFSDLKNALVCGTPVFLLFVTISSLGSVDTSWSIFSITSIFSSCFPNSLAISIFQNYLTCIMFGFIKGTLKQFSKFTYMFVFM